MKIAYFSPFPPQQTGVATYSKHLVAELRKIMEVHCYDFENNEAADATTTFADFGRTGRINALLDCDAVIYNLGNSPWHHLEIFRVLRQFKGIVLLHDIVLYYLFAGSWNYGLTKHFLLNYGAARINEVEDIISDCPERDVLKYPYPERYPLVGSIFPYASSIVVHNAFARDALLSLGYSGPIYVIPHLSYPASSHSADQSRIRELRQRHSIDEHDLVIGCFGFIGPTKRIHKVCEALALLRDRLSFKLLIVGVGQDVSHVIRANNLGDRTIRTDFASEAEFSLYLHLTDILVNLRHPSMGESSGTLIQAFTTGTPCIVTNDAFFRDLPDNCVVKINLGDAEVSELVDAIWKLAMDDGLRADLAKAAKRFAELNWAGPRVASEFKAVIEADIRQRAQEKLILDAQDSETSRFAANALRDSLLRCLPGHLRQSLSEDTDSEAGHDGKLSNNEIRWAYRLILNREPESDATIEEVRSKYSRLADVREALLASDEYRARGADTFFE